MQVYLQWHTVQWCFYPRIFFGNTRLYPLPWNSLVSGLHSQLGYLDVPGFVTGCVCSVWCRRLTTCPRYVGPIFGLFQVSLDVRLKRRIFFSLFWKYILIEIIDICYFLNIFVRFILSFTPPPPPNTCQVDITTSYFQSHRRDPYPS